MKPQTKLRTSRLELVQKSTSVFYLCRE